MSRPLAGVNALVTRPAGQAAKLAAEIRALGGVAICFPLIEIRGFAADDPARLALQQVLAALETFDIAIFISTNAVMSTLEQLRASGCVWPAALVCLAIGRATAGALAQAGMPVRAAASAMNSEALLALEELRDVSGRRIVIFKGEGGRELLATALAARGARVTECALYRRAVPAAAPGELPALLRDNGIDTLLISSGEGLANLLGLLANVPAGTMALVVPGERVAELARAHGFRDIEVAANATDQEMLAALRRQAARRRAGSETT